MVVLIVVILLVASLFTYALLANSSPAIQVANINVWSADNVCGLNKTLSYFNGFNTTTNSNITFEFSMPNYNSTPCTIHRLTTNTPGFHLYNVQIPRTIPAESTATLNITIKCPSSRFAGNLNLYLR